MTSDEAREIAIAVLRERAGVLGHPFEEAAAVLEALGPLGSIALPGVAPRTQGEPQANVEPRGCLCGGPMKCVRCGEEWFMPGQMQKTMDEAQVNVEEKKAARLTGPERNAIEALLNGMTQRHHRDILRALVEASQESAT